MKPYAVLAVFVLLGALFILAPSAFADCSPGTPGCPQPTPICPPDKPACWIIPPQSIEVNAGGVSAGPGAAGGGGAPVVLTTAQYRIEIPLVTPVPFPTRRPAATAEPSAQAGLTGEQASSPSGITWQEGLLAAAAAAMGAVVLHGTFTSPLGGQASGAPGLRPSTSGATSVSPSAGLSSARAGTGAQASASSAGPTSGGRGASSPSGGEASAFGEPTAEERRQGSGWGGVIGSAPRVTWQGDLSYVAGSRMSTATAERKAEDMLPRATWIPGGGRSDPGPESTPPPPTPPPPTPPAPPSAGSGASTGPTQAARDRWWESYPSGATPGAVSTPSAASAARPGGATGSSQIARDRWWEDGGAAGAQASSSSPAAARDRWWETAPAGANASVGATPPVGGNPPRAGSVLARDIDAEDVAGAAGQVLKWGMKINSIEDASALQFHNLPSGHVSVRVGSAVAEGEKIAFRQGEAYRYLGTRYNPGTVAGITSRNLLKSPFTKIGLRLGIGVPVVTNLVDYGFGEHRQQGILSHDFLASTSVDIVKGFGTGLAAAGIVAGGIALATAAGVTAVAAAPLWLAMSVAAGLGFVFGLAADHVVEKYQIKAKVADGLGAYAGIRSNAWTIVKTFGQKAGEALANTGNSVKGFFSNVFGGGSASSTPRNLGRGGGRVQPPTPTKPSNPGQSGTRKPSPRRGR
ncbi:MAG TPA: hypothetical protein VJ123_00275 [Anaerolineales bacterium]|nr:hypothetical protein [Anaerolineales bacterium]